MSKTKKSGDGHYEMLFIVPNKFTEDEAKKIIAKVEDSITKAEGKISFSEFWGKKKLAYKIKNNEYGYYSLCEFDLSKENLLKIDTDLRLSTEILRHQIISKRAKTEEEIKRNEEINAKIDSKKAKTKKDDVAESKKESKKEVKDKKDTKKGSNMKELDEKLEGILNADDLI